MAIHSVNNALKSILTIVLNKERNISPNSNIQNTANYLEIQNDIGEKDNIVSESIKEYNVSKDDNTAFRFILKEIKAQFAEIKENSEKTIKDYEPKKYQTGLKPPSRKIKPTSSEIVSSNYNERTK